MGEPGPVVVMGAASGIGAHVLERFAARGTEVIALDVVKPASEQAAFIECDLRDAASISAAVARLPDGLAAIAHDLSKEAVIAFITRWSAAIWRDQRVRLNTISPGPVETAILGDFEQSMGKELLDGVRAVVGRHATTADIAPVVEAACGPDFGWMVGQDVQLDGGFTAAMLSGGLAFQASSGG